MDAETAGETLAQFQLTAKEADVAILDPETVRDMSTFDQPHQYAQGVSTVVINGQVVFENGMMTAARPGRVLYGPAYVR